MDKERLIITAKLCSILSAGKRAEFLRKKKVFKSVGEHCIYMPRKVPLYPKLIKLGNYVIIASNVTFFTHDGIHAVVGPDNQLLPKRLRNHKFQEAIGCIEIGNHVFVGANSMIGYNVKIGDNVVVTAGSVVTNDIPSDSVVRGNPARVVCSFSQYLTLKAAKKGFPDELAHSMGSFVGEELEDWLWDEFYKSRSVGK